jgi:Na+/proline symporter
MIIVFIALFLVGYLAVKLLPGAVGFKAALDTAGHYNKMNIITSGFTEKGFDWKDKFNIWSGLIGGFFLSLSYFGTDHSQVGRYLTAKNIKETRKSLLMNGLVKIPMQFFILLTGVLIFSFYQFKKGPVYFDEVTLSQAKQTVKGDSLTMMEMKYQQALNGDDMAQANVIRNEFRSLMERALPGQNPRDTNYIFLRFVKDNLPVGLIGLVIAIIFMASWGSIAAALNSLAACTVVDFHKKFFVKHESEINDYRVSQWYTLAWGVFSIIIAMYAYNIGNSLIETVNIIGSLFYGVILGIFLVALWIKQVKGNAVFIAAILSELLVVCIYMKDIVSFLWLNLAGALLVIFLSVILQLFLHPKKKTHEEIDSGP